MLRRYDQITSVTDELEQLAPKTLADFELRAGKDIGILVEDGPGDVKPGGLGYGQENGRALQPFGLKREETMTLVSMTSRSGRVTALSARRGRL